MIPLQWTLGVTVIVQLCDSCLKFIRWYKKRGGAIVELLTGLRIGGRVVDQRQIVGGIGAGAGKAEAFCCFGNDIGQGSRIIGLLPQVVQAMFRFQQGPGKSGRVATVDGDRVEAVEGQVAGKPATASGLAEAGALIDAAAVGNHHRQQIAAVPVSPPAWCPVTATLLFEGAVTEKRYQ